MMLNDGMLSDDSRCLMMICDGLVGICWVVAATYEQNQFIMGPGEPASIEDGIAAKGMVGLPQCASQLEAISAIFVVMVDHDGLIDIFMVEN